MIASRFNRIRAFWLLYCLPRTLRATIVSVLKQRLTYLPKSRLVTLAQLCRRMDSRAIPGVIIEAGCALGGSSIVLAKAKARERSQYVYDVFGMIPPPGNEDGPDSHARYELIHSGKSNGIGGDAYYGYREDLYDTVLGNMRRFGCSPVEDNIALVKGDLQDTLALDGPVCLAHIDVDWYKPVKTCIARITPNLATGGVIVFDDYLEWSGCKKAVDECFLNCTAPGFTYDISSGSLVITKSERN